MEMRGKGQRSDLPSTSGEIKPFEQVSHSSFASPPRDFVRIRYDDGAKTQQEKPETLKTEHELERAWKEQINRKKSLVDHIRTNDLQQKIGRRNQYREAYIATTKEYKIEKLNLSDKFKAPSEHVNALKAINDKFETHLQSIGITLPVDNTSAHEPNKMMLKLDEEFER